MVEYPFATEEQAEFAEQARLILEKELAPRLEELEHENNGLGGFPLDVLKTLADAGYCGMTIPEKWGGLGFNHVTKSLILEEMSKVDAGFAFNFNACTMMTFEHIERSHIPDADKQAWADRLIAGESLGAFCLTEPSAGSDAAAIRATATYDEAAKEWVINGRKCFITNAPYADHFIVIAWTDKSKSAGKGMTAFLVEKDRGVQIGKMENKMGLKLSATADVIFDDVRVPEDHVIGEVGRGFGEAMSTLDEARICGMAYCLGIAQRAVEESVRYAQTRVAFGKPIIQHEGLGFLLANMEIRTQAARAILYQGAQMLDAGKPIGTISSASKVFVSESTMQTAVDAVQVFGGYGYMKDYPVEKLMRDAKIFCIFDGTTQIQQMIIARALDKKYRQ